MGHVMLLDFFCRFKMVIQLWLLKYHSDFINIFRKEKLCIEEYTT